MKTEASRKTEVQEIRIVAADGYELACTLYPGGDRVALVFPALAVLRRYYDAHARFLQGRGWTVLTLDYRGVGGSLHEPIRKAPGFLSDWPMLDMDAAIGWAVEERKPSKLAVVGHSIGGQVMAIAPRQDRVDAFVQVAAPTPFLEAWKGLGRLKLLFFWYFMIPVNTWLWGFLPMKLFRMGEDLPEGIAFQWARWGRQNDYTDGEGNSLRGRLADYRGPLLNLSFTDDPFYAPLGSVKRLLELYVNAEKEHRHIDPAEVDSKGIGHFGFFREGACPRLWNEVADWLERK